MTAVPGRKAQADNDRIQLDLRSVPPGLKRQLMMLAGSRGKSLSAYIRDVLVETAATDTPEKYVPLV